MPAETNAASAAVASAWQRARENPLIEAQDAANRRELFPEEVIRRRVVVQIAATSGNGAWDKVP